MAPQKRGHVLVLEPQLGRLQLPGSYDPARQWSFEQTREVPAGCSSTRYYPYPIPCLIEESYCPCPDAYDTRRLLRAFIARYRH